MLGVSTAPSSVPLWQVSWPRMRRQNTALVAIYTPCLKARLCLSTLSPQQASLCLLQDPRRKIARVRNPRPILLHSSSRLPPVNATQHTCLSTRTVAPPTCLQDTTPPLVLKQLADAIQTPLTRRMDGLGAFGTLILYGSMFASLATFFMDEFKAIPRIGGRKWDTSDDADDAIRDLEPLVIKRKARQRQETSDGLLWTAAMIRGCVVVKFGAREVEGGKRWLRSMLDTEGSVPAHFGERSLLCLR